jgi:hypothetical protein
MQEDGRVERKLDWIGDALQHITQRYVLDGWNGTKAQPIDNENWDLNLDLIRLDGPRARCRDWLAAQPGAVLRPSHGPLAEPGPDWVSPQATRTCIATWATHPPWRRIRVEES